MAQSRVAWDLQQTQKAVGNMESDLKGYMQDVRTLTLQLNEAQVEALHAFACLEQQCTIVATQKANMTHAAPQRRRVFKSRADAALVQEQGGHGASVIGEVEASRAQRTSREAGAHHQAAASACHDNAEVTHISHRSRSSKLIKVPTNLCQSIHTIAPDPSLLTESTKQKQVSQTA